MFEAKILFAQDNVNGQQGAETTQQEETVPVNEDALQPPDAALNPANADTPPSTGKTETLLDTLNTNADQALKTQQYENPDDTDHGEDSGFNEDEFLFNYEGPTVDVIHDNRSGSDYVRVHSKNESIEYHYLSQIKYGDLVFVLTDLLKRVTDGGYRWADDLTTEFEDYTDEPAIIYKVDKVYDKVFGIIQFPDFRIWFSGTKEAIGNNRHDALKPSVMSGLIMQFMFSMAKVEEVLGINQMEYGKKFFKPDD
ncbi:MAG: hypothetical protein Ta2B_04930 [Termitinemataceae bacterium]|nr:MAG: hypothetical protein Ta2B_04930 [Termitinemataceae bacterium]